MPPETPKQPKSAAEARRDRQAAALRDNLRKRKAQARDKLADVPDSTPERDPDGTDTA